MTDFYARLDHLARRPAPVVEGAPWDLTRFEYKVMSQNGEDGVLQALLALGGQTNRWFVEFGASDGTEGTCAYLAQVLGWSGLLVEPDPGAHASLADRYADRDDVTVVHAAVTVETIAEIFDGADVPAEPDVVCIDVDGNDAYLLQALPRRPRFLVVEYNGSLPRDRELRWTQPRSSEPWDGTRYFGASLGALEAIAQARGYRLVHTDLAGVNAFFARDDVTLPPGLQPPRRPASYNLRGAQHPVDPHGRAYVELDV